mmetsp:Transcript_16231/g.30655  ORF Transcript_16231/g.30655 Transcript_16231/m.30655 type:complete len:1185 (-) Transcript_16231:63-3617(-)
MRFHSAACAAVLSAAASASAFSFSPLAVPSTTARNNGHVSFAAPTRPAFGLLSNTLTISSTSHAQPSSTSLNLAAGGGPEALEDYIATLSNTESKLSSKLQNPKLVKLAGAAALPLSYVVGAAMTPSRRLAARAVGGVITAVTAGGVGKSFVEEDVRRSCPAAIAKRLFELGVDDANISDGIARLQEDYGVDDEDFLGMCTEVYAVYLAGMAKNPLAKTAELKELASLKAALDLDNQQTGQAHADAAAAFYRDVTRFTSIDELDDEGHPDRVSLDKLLFLSERAFRQGGETDEAFTFEFSRVAKALGGLSVNEALERAKDVATPFYERALASTRAKLNSGAVSADMLSRARGTLGIEDVEAKDMHIEAFGREVRSQLGLPEDDDEDDMDDYNEYQDKRVETVAEVKKKLDAMKAEEETKEVEDTSDIKFTSGAFDTLTKLQDVLGLSDEDADYEISAATVDYWRNTALSAIEDAIAKTKTPAKAWEVIQSRQKELYLKDSSMKDMMTSMVMQALGRPLEKVNGFARVNNAAATYDGLVDAIAAKETCKDVLKEAGWSEFEDFEEACFDPSDNASACGFLTNQDRHNMYQIFFTRSVKTDEDGTKDISEESYGLMKELRGMLGVSEEEGVGQIRNFFGPELQIVLTDATEEILRGNTTDALLTNLKENVDKVINDYKLDEEMVRSYAGPLYNRAVEEIGSNTPGGIPSVEEVETLSFLRTLLNISEEETYDVHLTTFGTAYKKAIKEALGTTGVIREEYREPLDDLRARLGMSDEAAKEIYMEAIGERMKPMVEFISNEMERLVLTKDQLAQKRGTDFGEDYFKDGSKASGKLGLGTDGNIMSDIMTLIDFYIENGIVQKEVVGTKKIEKKIPADEEGGEEKTITEEEPIYESTYPITATGMGCIDTQVAELCYRQFVVSSFTDQSPNAARYEASKATFGGILGLTAEKMEEIGSNIGGMVYDNYITQAMATKSALDQQDMMFLANMQGKLGISAEKGEEMLLDTQKKIISEEASALFDSGSATPEKVKEFREKCNSMGMDLETDVGLTKSRLVNMFSMEITPGIDSGEITMDSADVLAEIQESLGLTEEEGEEVVAGLITERANGILADIVGCMLRGMDAVAVESMEKLVQYAAFVDGDLGLNVEESNANKAFNLFESKDWTGVDTKVVEKQKSLLKTAFGMSA